MVDNTDTRRRPFGGILSVNKDILLHGVLPYLTLLTDVVSVASTCKELSRLVYRHSQLWEMRESSAHECQAPMKMCLLKSCSGCGRTKIDIDKALHLLARAPIRYLSVHMPFQYFVHLAKAIHRRKTVVDLCVKFTSFDCRRKLQLPPQFLGQNSSETSINEYAHTDESNIEGGVENESSIKDAVDSNSVFLKNITFFGWPNAGLDMVQYCEAILAVIGSESQSIQFYNSSPRGILWKLTSVCPNLVDVFVEGDQSLVDGGACAVSSSTLTTLRLSHTRTRLNGHSLQTPNLSFFEFLDDVNASYDAVFRGDWDVADFVRAIPPRVKDLGVRIASVYADGILSAITGHLHHLESLQLHLPDGTGFAHGRQEWDDAGVPRLHLNGNNHIITEFSAEQMVLLRTECPRLVSLEISNTFISLQAPALLALGELDTLRRIKLLYSEELVQALPRFLAISRQIEEVAFFEDVAIGSEEWLSIDNKIAQVSDLFPSVLIHVMHEDMD